MPRRPRPWFRKSKNAWFAWIDNKQIRLAVGRNNRDKAERELLKKLLARTAIKPLGEAQTIASVIIHYLARAKGKLSGRTLYERRAILQRFADDRGERLASDCLPLTLSDWIDGQKAWQSDWTRHTANAAIQRAFNWAVKQRVIPGNPFAGVSYPTGGRRRPMTDDEFRALLRETGKSGYGKTRKPTPGARVRQLLFFMRWTGCRPGEAASLKWTDLNIEAASIVLKVHKTSRTQKEPQPRVIMLMPVVCRLLAWIRRRGEPGEYVFHNHRMTTWNRSNLSLRIRRTRERAGLPNDVKLYGIRHGFGTRAIVNGVDLKTLAELLGHTTTRMSEWYVHLAGERAHLAAAMQRAGALDPTPRRKPSPKPDATT